MAPAVLTVTSLGDSGAGTLRDQVNAAAAGDTINFDSSLNNGTVRLTSGQISINKDLTITWDNGTMLVNVTVDGSARDRIFDIGAGNNVTITGLTLTNGFARRGAGLSGNGGAIHDSGTLTLNNVSLNDNHAGSSGGAIDVSRHNNASLTANNSTFLGNRAIAGFGGAISSNDQDTGAGNLSMTVNNSTFTANSSSGSGGAIDYFVPATSNGTYVLSVSGSTFRGNEGSNGGAIDANDSPNGGTLTITISGNNTFDSNHAFGPLSQVAHSSDSGYGGAIDAFLRLAGTATATVSFSGGTYTGNWANFGAVATTLRTTGDSTGAITFNGVTFSNNQAVWGAGLYNELSGGSTANATITVSTNTFNDNVAASDQSGGAPPRPVNGQGGGIFGTVAATPGSTAALSYANDTVAYNSAVTSTPPTNPTNGNGGGLYLERTLSTGTVSVTLNSLTVAYNYANDNGGGLFVDNTNTFSPLVRNSVFDANQAGASGPDENGSVTSGGFNTLSSAGTGFTDPTDVVDTVAGIKLDTALSNNGGSTLTLLPLTGSSLIGSGDTSPLPTDQRGFTRANPTTRGAVDVNGSPGGMSQGPSNTFGSRADTDLLILLASQRHSRVASDVYDTLFLG
jgi:hypothetical protein